MTDDWQHDHTEERMAIPLVAPKTEPELLAAVEHGEDGARVVYGDWLEEQGDHERAEYLRLQDAILELPDGAERQQAKSRVTELARKLDAAWRVLVARPRIRRCKREGCPREWGSLATTHTSDLRICRTCDARITFRFRVESGTEPCVFDNEYDGDDSDWATTGEWMPP